MNPNPAPALVVLPTYNERDGLPQVVLGVRSHGHDVLIVDDASPDGTGVLADQLAASDGGVAVIHRPRKLGLGSAYVAGFRQGLEGRYGFLVEMDSDGSHRLEHLDPIIEACAGRGGLVIGSRYVKGGTVAGWPRRRRFLSWAANRYCQLLLGWSVRDATSGYRCYSRSALESIGLEDIRSSGYEFQIEMVHRCLRHQLSIAEVPISFEDRIAGRSKVSRAEVLNGLIGVLRLRFQGRS